MRNLSTRLGAGILATASAFALALQCVPASADDDDAAPPDPGVARISVAQGIDVRRADTGDTYAAAVNAPVSVGDYISTDDGGRGEIEFDYGSALRMAPATQLRFTVLEPHHHVLQLAAGTVDLRVFRGLAAHAEVETPSATVRPAGDGSFRVTVTNDGNTEVTARSGHVDVVTSSGNQSLEPGPTLLIAGNADRPQIQTIDAVAFDSFDSFNRSRDSFVERAHDWAYVDAGFVGADDLDAYGRWSDVPGYGQVWQPTEQPDGWAPYTTGRWVWEPYYGWSWVDSSPWGYAPYHYGRWFYADANWYWAPGIAVAAPLYYSAPVAYYPHPVYYRPALVAFFSFGGGGFGGGLDIGFGNVGWCALAPSEPFHPWYGSGYGGGTVINRTTVINNYGNTYVNNGNVNNGNITRTYRNINAPGGAVAVNNGNFANGNFTHLVRLQRTQLAGATPVRGVVPVVPTASNLAFSSHAIEPLATRAPVNTRFARFTTQPKVPFASFAEQQRAVQSVAVKTYPEHATVFQHPEIQQKYDRPGLITRENVPDEFKPSANPRGGTTNEPAGARTEERGTYGRQSTNGVESGTTKPAVAPAQADPFARFSHSPDAHVGSDRAATAPAPAYGTPAEKTPSYAVPADRATAPEAPVYKAPSDRTPSYATPVEKPRAAVEPRAYETPDEKTRSHTTSTHDAPAYREPAEYKSPVKTPSYATPYKAPVHDEQRYRAPVAPSAANRSASRPHPKPTDDKK